MKNITNKDLIYSLHDTQNFKKELDCEITDVANKLSQLFIDYLKFIIENIQFKQLHFYRFIIIRGLDTIVNVFNHILFYTKNLDATFFHCQKAFYFYIEFVDQISEDDNLFLQLSSKDATIYVYKKTIYNINTKLDILNEDNSYYTKLKFQTINNFVDLYKTLLLHLINHDFNNIQNIKSIEDLYNTLNNLNDTSLIEKLNILVEKIYYHVNDVDKFYSIIRLIIKKMINNPDMFENKKHKLLSPNCLDKLNDTPNNFIKWFTH